MHRLLWPAVYWLLLACCAQAQEPPAAPQEPPAALPLEEPASAAQSPTDPAGAHGAPDDGRQAQAMYEQYVQRVAQALVASGQARETALAAMLVSEHGALRAQAAPWWQAALASAGRDGMVYRMALLFMRPHNPQEPHATTGLRQDAARRWLALDAGNLAPVLYQDVPAAQLLAQAAASTHFDLHLHASLRWIYATMHRHPPTAQEAQVFQQTFLEDGEPPWTWEDMLAITVMGLQAAHLTPHYNKLFTACKPDALHAHPAHLAPCHRAAWVLGSRATTVHETILGLRMQMHLATSAQECQSLRAKSMQLRWLSRTWGEQWQHAGIQGLLRYAVRMFTSAGLDREQDAMRAFLRERGAPAEPPPGWSDGHSTNPCAPLLP